MKQVQFALGFMTKGTAREFADAYYTKVTLKMEGTSSHFVQQRAWGTWEDFETAFWTMFKAHNEQN
jgi:hypothetical protein